MVTKTEAPNIFRCSGCNNMVQKPHPKWECVDFKTIQECSQRAEEVIECVKRTSEYLTIRRDMLHRILRDAWREGYEKGKNVLRLK